MNVEYAVPSSLQFSNTYFHLNLGNGAYITTPPGSTFTEEFRYNFWTDQSTETINKGDTTTILMTLIISGKSLREAGSKTTVEIEYPSDIECVSLEETQLYHRNGTVVSIAESGGIKTTKVEWDEPGSYSGTPIFAPHVKVPANSILCKWSTFNSVLRKLKKKIWDDTPNVDYISCNVSTIIVKMKDNVDL